jgi:hypothetical protein
MKKVTKKGRFWCVFICFLHLGEHGRFFLSLGMKIIGGFLIPNFSKFG